MGESGNLDSSIPCTHLSSTLSWFSSRNDPCTLLISYYRSKQCQRINSSVHGKVTYQTWSSGRLHRFRPFSLELSLDNTGDACSRSYCLCLSSMCSILSSSWESLPLMSWKLLSILLCIACNIVRAGGHFLYLVMKSDCHYSLFKLVLLPVWWSDGHCVAWLPALSNRRLYGTYTSFMSTGCKAGLE